MTEGPVTPDEMAAARVTPDLVAAALGAVAEQAAGDPEAVNVQVAAMTALAQLERNWLADIEAGEAPARPLVIVAGALQARVLALGKIAETGALAAWQSADGMLDARHPDLLAATCQTALQFDSAMRPSFDQSEFLDLAKAAGEDAP